MTLMEYTDPPLHDVTLSVQFDSRVANNFSLSKVVNNLTTDTGYRFVAENQAIPPRLESNQMDWSAGGQLSFIQGAGANRFEFATADKQRKILFQNDRLSFTWTRAAGSRYPRYEHIRDEFLSWFDKVESQYPVVTLKQAEVQYINQVDDDNFEGHKNFKFLNLQFFKNYEGVTFATSQMLTNKNEVGRLFLEAKTSHIFEVENGQASQKRKLRVFLTFRGKPKSLDNQGLSKFLDRGRGAIVSTFTDSLTTQARKAWGEQERGSD